nr:hypothetical protein [Tanacetum cinerariifolium]
MGMVESEFSTSARSRSFNRAALGLAYGPFTPHYLVSHRGGVGAVYALYAGAGVCAGPHGGHAPGLAHAAASPPDLWPHWHAAHAAGLRAGRALRLNGGPFPLAALPAGACGGQRGHYRCLPGAVSGDALPGRHFYGPRFVGGGIVDGKLLGSHLLDGAVRGLRPRLPRQVAAAQPGSCSLTSAAGAGPTAGAEAAAQPALSLQHPQRHCHAHWRRAPKGAERDGQARRIPAHGARPRRRAASAAGPRNALFAALPGNGAGAVFRPAGRDFRGGPDGAAGRGA